MTQTQVAALIAAHERTPNPNDYDAGYYAFTMEKLPLDGFAFDGMVERRMWVTPGDGTELGESVRHWLETNPSTSATIAIPNEELARIEARSAVPYEYRFDNPEGYVKDLVERARIVELLRPHRLCVEAFHATEGTEDWDLLSRYEENAEFELNEDTRGVIERIKDLGTLAIGGLGVLIALVNEEHETTYIQVVAGQVIAYQKLHGETRIYEDRKSAERILSLVA